MLCTMQLLKQIFLGQITDKQMPRNAFPKFFTIVDTKLDKMQMKFGTGDKKVPTSSIEQKSS